MLSQFADIQEAQGNIERIDDVFSQTEWADEEDNVDDSDNEGEPDGSWSKVFSNPCYAHNFTLDGSTMMTSAGPRSLRQTAAPAGPSPPPPSAPAAGSAPRWPRVPTVAPPPPWRASRPLLARARDEATAPQRVQAKLTHRSEEQGGSGGGHPNVARPQPPQAARYTRGAVVNGGAARREV